MGGKIRSIYPEACTSEKLANVSAEAERLYWRLMTHVDDEGRCEDNPKVIRGACLPLHDDVSSADVDATLDELDAEGLLVRYEIDGRRYLEVTGWKQKPRWPKPSRFPPSSDGCPTRVRQLSDDRPTDAGTSSPELSRDDQQRANAKRSAVPFSADFDEAWSMYPRKVARLDALKAYQARRRAGATYMELKLATANYAAAMALEGREQSKILHGATFYGPHERWRDYSTPTLSLVETPAIDPPPSMPRCEKCARLEIDCRCALRPEVEPRFKDMGRR